MKNEHLILIVDDNVDNRFSLKYLLEDEEYTALEAENGKEAVEATRINKPDLIISDILMPVMDGYQLLMELNKDAELKDIPFVFYTGNYTSSKDEEFALNLGALRYFVKPMDPLVLLKEITKLLNDKETGSTKIPERKIKDENEIIRLYNERLINMLEQKIRELDRENTNYRNSLEDLRKSELRYESLFNYNQSVMLLIDPDTAKIVDANPSACKFYKYDIDRLKTMKITDINQLSDADVFVEMEKAREKKCTHFHFRHKLSNNEIRDVEVYCGPIFFEDKELLYSIIHDITPGVMAEEALKESEKRFRLLYENAPLSYQSLNIDGNLIDVNPKWLESLGYEKDEVLGKHFSDFLTSESGDLFIQRFPLFIENGETHDAEFEMKKKNGSTIHVTSEGVIAFEQDGSFKQTHCIFTDISDRIRNERALKESQDFNQALLETSPDLIYIYDIIDRKNVYSNSGITKILGYSIEEIQEMGETMMSRLMHPEDLIHYFEEIVPQYGRMAEKDLLCHEYRMKHKDGRWIWLESKETIFQWTDDNTPKQILGLTSDITLKKQADEEHEEYKEKLEKTVKERTKELEDTLRVFVGRELTIRDLQKRIKVLENKK